MAKTKQPRWLLPALLALGVLAFALLGSRLRVSYRTSLSGCVYDGGTGGASGLYRWCGRMGIPATLLEVPLGEAPRTLPAPSGNVLLTMGDGPWSPSGEEESVVLREVREWLKRGNALIVVTSKPSSLPSAFREELLADKLNQIDTGQPAGPPAPAALLIAKEVQSRPDTVELPVTGDGSLTVEAQSARWKPIAPKSAGAAATAPLPDGAATDTKPEPPRWQLAGDAGGGVLFRFPIGSGACYVLLDAFPWTNAGLDAGENARVLAGILGREVRGGSLAIDEHRHGHGRAESFLTYLLSLPGASAFLWLALAWALLYYYTRNVRLRPAERHAVQERRTAQEYIDAVAQLHERARAAPLAVEAVAGRLRQLARSSVEHEAAVETLLREADAYVKAEGRPASPRDAIRLVTELVQLRKRLYGSRTIS
ncbi:MAG: hypothetical protein P4L85_00040 [Paludisphaera borealis]|uniref:DUF4350 domain-containing protein n=1 Tax=Paludisphaera borealis TaxID=1387353 RepID=UPI00284382E0|nr:DUF4350 domain-containing protein [Paludisphaera borealis]MDR3617713.1 hypothetical protein [Paludisphaera borealis]